MKKETKKNASPKKIKRVKNRGEDFYYYKYCPPKDNNGLAALAEILNTNNQTVLCKINGETIKIKLSESISENSLRSALKKQFSLSKKKSEQYLKVLDSTFHKNIAMPFIGNKNFVNNSKNTKLNKNGNIKYCLNFVEHGRIKFNFKVNGLNLFTHNNQPQICNYTFSGKLINGTDAGAVLYESHTVDTKQPKVGALSIKDWISQLPKGVMTNIFEKSDRHSLANLARVSKHYNELTNNNFFWKKRLKDHFTTIFNKTPKETADYKKLFKATENEIYKELNEKQRRLFYYVKSNMLQKIKELHHEKKIDNEDLLIFDNNNENIISLFTKERAPIYKYLFEEIVCSETNFSDSHDDTGHSHIHWAVALNQIEVVKKLCALGQINLQAKYTKRTPLHIAIRCNRPEIFKYLINLENNLEKILSLTDSHGSTPLHSAARKGNVTMCEKLIDKGANINAQDAKGNTPLIKAIQRGKEIVVKYLLSNKKVSVNKTNKLGCNALHIVASKGKLELELVTKLLKIDQGILNSVNVNNETPLLIAIYFSHTDIAMHLLKQAGINGCINIPLGNCYSHPELNASTALHLAASQGNFELIKALLEKGANPDLKNEANKTPIDHAATKEIKIFLKLASYLQNIEARKNDYYFSFCNGPQTLFGNKFNYSKGEKKGAAKALKKYLISRFNNDDEKTLQVNKSELKKHQGALTNGNLGDIYKLCELDFTKKEDSCSNNNSLNK